MRQWRISTVSENKERLIKAAIENGIWAIITRSVFLVNYYSSVAECGARGEGCKEL